MTIVALHSPFSLAAWQVAPHAERTYMEKSLEKRLHNLVVSEGDFVARSLRNLGVFGGELDDCVQKVFLVVARKLTDIERGKERAFLFACARNTAAHFRRSLARKREVSDDVLAESPHTQGAPDVLTEQKRYRALLDQILETMDEELREIFVLHAFEELTMAEIAEMLQIPSGTVASRLRRARERFKLELTRLREKDIQETA